MTDAFKNNNALFRDQLNAIKGDIAQELTKHIEIKARENQEQMQNKIDELEKNINITFENIKQNGKIGNGRERRESQDGESDGWHNGKGNKYGFNRDYKLENNDKSSD